MSEKEIVSFIHKVMSNPQLQIPASEARKLVACLDWLENKGADNGAEKEQPST